jgi:hypothetical protein
MTTLETAILIDVTPKEALTAKPAPGALPTQLPATLRLQQYPYRFKEYDNTWQCSELLLKEILA